MLCRNCPCRPNCLPARVTGGPLAAFEGAIKQRELQQRHTLVREGDPFRGYYAVRSGSLKALAAGKDGTDSVIMFLFPGDIAGLGAVSHRWPKSLIALESTQLCWIPESVANQGGLESRLSWLIGVRLRRIYLAHINRASRVSARRLAAFLAEVGSRLAPDGPEKRFELPMHQREIASYLGLTTEATNRAFGALRKQGLIQQEGKAVKIPDSGALRQYFTSESTPRPV